MADPQPKFYDDQNILNVNFDDLYNNYIRSIDAYRSHFNALQNDLSELNTPEYQESRCHAYYRMIGFPVVSDSANFYSPGFDPNLNTDFASINTYKGISDVVLKSTTLTNQFYNREIIPIFYKKIFNDAGNNSQAIAFGSVFIREFDKQLSNTGPLVDDPNKTQIINERIDEVNKYFADVSKDILISKHQLKPFAVDPRIDNSVRPIKNRICAPFLKDKTQTKVFQSSQGSSEGLKRPFIEKVISVRFNNQNNTTSSEFINQIISEIESDQNVKDETLLSIQTDSFKNLHNSELIIFDKHYKLLRIIIDKLIISIRSIQDIKQNINFKPIPDKKIGVENGNNGGKLQSPDPADTSKGFNKPVEVNIIEVTKLKALDDINFDAGLQGIPDPGDFAFSDLDDLVGSAYKDVKKSHDEHLSILTERREHLGTIGINSLRNIEIIMGEFSGIGLIDIVSIQAALWIMEPNKLLGLIDKRAFDRIKYRRDININGFSQADVLESLKEFEKQLNNIYFLVQKYYNEKNNGMSQSI